MFIVNELKRIKTAIQDMILEISKKGVVISSDATLEDICSAISDIEMPTPYQADPSFETFEQYLQGNIDEISSDLDLSDIKYVFFGHTNLKTLILPNITKVADSACRGCTNLSRIDAQHITAIENHSFYGCAALSDIMLENVTTIGTYAFYGCSSMTAAAMPNVTSIGASAFEGCSGLTSLDLPNVTIIESSTFSNCTSLASVNMPNVVSIKDSAFYGCSSLTTLRLPAAVKSLPAKVFRNCKALTILIVESNTLCTAVSTTFTSSGLSRGSIYVVDSLVDAYKVATGWSAYASLIKPISELG